MDAVAKGTAVRCEADTHSGAVNTGTGGTPSFLVIFLPFSGYCFRGWALTSQGLMDARAEILSSSAILQSA